MVQIQFENYYTSGLLSILIFISHVHPNIDTKILQCLRKHRPTDRLQCIQIHRECVDNQIVVLVFQVHSVTDIVGAHSNGNLTQ